MKLLKLSANKNSFRPVIFNKEGISLICPAQVELGKF